MACAYCEKTTTLGKTNSGKVIPLEDKYCSQCGKRLINKGAACSAEITGVEIHEITKRLEDLAWDRQSFFRNDGGDEVFREDYAALRRAIELLVDLYMYAKHVDGLVEYIDELRAATWNGG